MHTKNLAVLKKQVRFYDLEEILLYTIKLKYFVHKYPKHFMAFGTQLMRKKMVKGAKECMKMQATNSEIYGKMHAVFIEMDSSANVRITFM